MHGSRGRDRHAEDRDARGRQRLPQPGRPGKEAATIELLSDGRFLLGIGAGWLRSDYRADRQAAAAKLAPAQGLPPDVVLSTPYFQIGPLGLIAENLMELRDRWGISYIAFQQDATEIVASMVARLAGT